RLSPPADFVLELVDRARAREVEALRVVGTELVQARDLPLGLDALGDDLEAQRARHAQHGTDDRGVPVVAAEPADERAVDLDDVEREALEVSERGVAGPEVVERQPHTDVLEARE